MWNFRHKNHTGAPTYCVSNSYVLIYFILKDYLNTAVIYVLSGTSELSAKLGNFTNLPEKSFTQFWSEASKHLISPS